MLLKAAIRHRGGAIRKPGEAHTIGLQQCIDKCVAILAARVERRWGPHRLGPLTGHPRSTVYAVLARTGYSRLRDADRASGVPVRYVHDHPGSLVHQDHKKLGRIPDGGGHRMLGRGGGIHRGHGQLGYDHFEVVIDDATRLADVPRSTDSVGAPRRESASPEYRSAP
jgi:hypothetical protein